MLRSTSIALSLLALVACENKNKPKQDNNKPATPTPKPNDDNSMTPEPVGKDPGEVRPPVAADLAEYTKDMKGSKLTATIDTTLGTFHCELYPDKTPLTIANFVGLATGKKPWTNPKTGSVEKGKPFYDGLLFHRVIPGFMIQGGDPLGQGTGGPGYQFADEYVTELKMEPGTLAMANANRNPGDGTNGSQFFITDGSPDWLNGRHTVFGKCKEVDLVTKIENVEKMCTECPRTDPNHDRPKTDVVINKITIAKE
jgi:peptidyl-prolyl cis-trans isomerase A (cyclophilin A)